MLKTAERITACPGRALRVATSVAIALAASWNPFVSAKTMEKAMFASPSSTIRWALRCLLPTTRQRRPKPEAAISRPTPNCPHYP